jgi:ribosomal protein L37AE/L43A
MELVQTVKQAEEKQYWWRDEKESKNSCAIRFQPGHTCPECREGVLAYDGLFMLTCPTCGYIAEGGAFT